MTALHDPNLVRYARALADSETGSYEDAAASFLTLGDYKEADALEKDTTITYSIPWKKNGTGSTYYKIYNHVITLYNSYTDKKVGDLYRVRFISDTKAEFYSYKDYKTYTLTKN